MTEQQIENVRKKIQELDELREHYSKIKYHKDFHLTTAELKGVLEVVRILDLKL